MIFVGNGIFAEIFLWGLELFTTFVSAIRKCVVNVQTYIPFNEAKT